MSIPDSLPVAEIFTSVHGEGFWAGTPMTFFRLAGCTVGRAKAYSGEGRLTGGELMPILPSGKRAFECTTFDNRKFPCDTDFRRTFDMQIKEFPGQIPQRIGHVCVTGGEPLMHEGIERLVDLLIECGMTVHIETSGTIMPKWSPFGGHIYHACSPKANYLPAFLSVFADEIRLMVDKGFNLIETQKLLQFVSPRTQIFLSPLSSPHNVMEFDRESLDKCMELINTVPELSTARISIQMHKILGVR